jgi:RNA polymerase sigma-70 factor (ECF subfamily)
MYEREISQQEQRELIRRAKECDPSAFARIYEHYYQDIYNYIYYRIKGNVHLAEDLAAEVFLIVLESIDTYTFRGIPFSAWLFRIAKNVLGQYFRKESRPVDLPLEEPIPVEVSPGDIVERGLTQQQLVQALRDLTEDQQEVIILKFVDGLSNAEAGQVLGKSEGAIKSLQHRALNSLNRILEMGVEREQRQ